VKVAYPRNVAGEVVALLSTFKQPEESIEAPAEGFAERASIVSTRPRTNRGPIIMQSRRGLALSFLLAGSAVVATTRLRQKSACLKTTLKLPKGLTVVGLLVGLETLASPRPPIDAARPAHILEQTIWRRSHQSSRRSTQLFVCFRNNSSPRQVTSPTAFGLNTD
jgi:hypothetical protein